jgi:hypothetical protein
MRRQFLAILEFGYKKRPKSAPMCVLAALQILFRFTNGLLDRLDALRTAFLLAFGCLLDMALEV